MRLELRYYLQNIKQQLRLDPASEKEVIRELEAHVEDSCQEMRNAGLPEREALEKCLRVLGPAKDVARQFYEAHNQGTWRQALLAALPHLFFAAMFALKWLIGITWWPIMLLVILGIGLYGWGHGKPAWLFPWLSYALFPVVAAGVSLLYLPTAWAWVTLALYIPLVLWLFSFITIKFIRRDWLYSALALLPACAFTGWYLAADQSTRFQNLEISFLYDFAPWTGLTFLVMAVSVALFIRLRRRWLRVTALIISGALTSMVTFLASNKLNFISCVIFALLILSFLVVPAFVERKVKREIPSIAPEENQKAVL